MFFLAILFISFIKWQCSAELVATQHPALNTIGPIGPTAPILPNGAFQMPGFHNLPKMPKDPVAPVTPGAPTIPTIAAVPTIPTAPVIPTPPTAPVAHPAEPKIPEIVKPATPDAPKPPAVPAIELIPSHPAVKAPEAPKTPEIAKAVEAPKVAPTAPVTPVAPKMPEVKRIPSVIVSKPINATITEDTLVHFTPADLIYEFKKTDNKTLLNYTLIFMEQVSHGEIGLFYRKGLNYLQYLFSHLDANILMKPDQQEMQHNLIVQWLAQSEIVRANVIQADFYRQLNKQITGDDSDDLRHEWYNGETTLVNAIDRYHKSIGEDFRLKVRVLTKAVNNAKNVTEIVMGTKEKFALDAPRKFIPLANREYNGQVAPGPNQNQTQFSDHRHGQKITSFLNFVCEEDKFNDSIAFVNATLNNLEAMKAAPAAKQQAYQEMSKVMTDLRESVLDLWLSRPPIPESVDADMQKIISSLSDMTDKFEKVTKITIPKEYLFVKDKDNKTYIIKRASNGQQLVRTKNRTPPTKTLNRYRHQKYTEEEKKFLEGLKFDYLQAKYLDKAKHILELLRVFKDQKPNDIVDLQTGITWNEFIRDHSQVAQGLLMAIKRINRTHSLHDLYFVNYEMENLVMAVTKDLNVVTKLDKSGQIILDINMPKQALTERKPLKTGFFDQFHFDF